MTDLTSVLNSELAKEKENKEEINVAENKEMQHQGDDSTIIVKDKKGEAVTIDQDVLKNDLVTPVESIGNLESYSNSMDEELQQAKKEYETKMINESKLKDVMTKKASVKNQFNDHIVELDDNEVEEIKDEKVENKPVVDLTSIVIKKSKKLTEEDILKKYMKKVNDKESTTRVVLVNSGYAANLAGFSSPALRNIANELSGYDREFGAADYRYRLIYSKLKDTSVGEMDYATFLKTTALLELELLFYGIVCSTFPDKNEFPGECPTCGNKFKYTYYNTDYLKVKQEDFDEVSDQVVRTLKGQVTNMSVDQILENAPTNLLRREILQDSGIVVELRQPTLYNHLYDVLKVMDDKETTSALVSSMPFIESVLVPEDIDDEGNVSYFKLESMEAKLAVLEQLREKDDIKLAESIKEIIDMQKIEFSVRGVRCTNPECKHEYPEQLVSMEKMLFMIHQIRISSK